MVRLFMMSLSHIMPTIFLLFVLPEIFVSSASSPKSLDRAAKVSNRRWTLKNCLDQIIVSKISEKNSFNQFEKLLKDDQINFYKKLEASKYTGNYTFFIPIDDSYSTLQNMSTTDKHKYIQYHMYPGHHTARSIRDGGTLTSLEGSKAFTNRLYDSVSKRIRFWIQGAEIVTRNIHIGDNLIHIIDRAITPPTWTLFEYLKQSGRHDIIFAQLEKYSVFFQFPFGVTFFAPFDDAFSNIPFKVKEQILKDDLNTRNFIRDHVIRQANPRGRLYHKTGWFRTINDNGKTLQLFQDPNHVDQSFVNSASVVSAHQVKEGWVYSISDFLLPNIKQKTIQVLKELKCKTFIKYVMSSGLFPVLDSLVMIYTIFAPNDQAFEQLNGAVRSKLQSDPEYLRQVIDYHMVQGKELTEQMTKRKLFKTDALPLAQSSTTSGGIQNRLNLFVDNFMGTIQSSRIVQSDNIASNGVVHVVNKVLLPPEQSTKEYISNTVELRLLSSLYGRLNQSLHSFLESYSTTYTLFLPTNNAVESYFNTLGLTATEEEQVIEALQNCLWNQYIDSPLILTPGTPINGINLTFKNGKTLNVKQGSNGKYTIDGYNSALIKINQITMNGVIHLVDRVFCN